MCSYSDSCFPVCSRADTVRQLMCGIDRPTPIQRPNTGDTNPAECTNAEFEAYYARQLKGTLVPDAEWDLAIGALKTSLPLTVRVSKYRPECE